MTEPEAYAYAVGLLIGSVVTCATFLAVIHGDARDHARQEAREQDQIYRMLRERKEAE